MVVHCNKANTCTWICTCYPTAFSGNAITALPWFYVHVWCKLVNMVREWGSAIGFNAGGGGSGSSRSISRYRCFRRGQFNSPGILYFRSVWLIQASIHLLQFFNENHVLRGIHTIICIVYPFVLSRLIFDFLNRQGRPVYCEDDSSSHRPPACGQQLNCPGHTADEVFPIQLLKLPWILWRW